MERQVRSVQQMDEWMDGRCVVGQRNEDELRPAADGDHHLLGGIRSFFSFLSRRVCILIQFISHFANNFLNDVRHLFVRSFVFF